MNKLLRHPATGIWLLLVLATAVSWRFGTDQGAFAEQHHLYITFALFIIAFIKVRFVILRFMEVRTAPWALRLICEAWTFLTCAAILGLYILAPR